MNNFSKITYLTAVWLLALSASAVAEETNSEKLPSVSPQFGIQYTTEGSGFESLGSLDAFVPVFQTNGKNVTFVQGRLFLDNDSEMGGHVLFGHRIYNPEKDQVVGTYIAYDGRDTEENYFKQLGFGFESLSKVDFRANAYLPLGDSRQQVGNSINTGTAVFSGNSVFAQQLRSFELGLHGIDAEVGTKLARLGSGDLRAYAGGYYFSAGGKEAFGWKTRLEARPTNFVGVNLSLQHDALFDTKAVVSVGVNFPGSGAKRGTKQNQNWARMGSFVERRTTIAVTNDTQLGLSAALTNPATGNAWNIIYVADTGNSNGTVESPYGFDKFSQALEDAKGKPGSLIYVRSNINENTLPAFEIPNLTEVASSLTRRTIDTRELGIVGLPFADLDVFSTTIQGDFTLKSNTILNGFTVNGTVLGQNISDVDIINNTIQDGEGINLTNATGKVNITNNTILNSQANAIIISNDSGNAEVAIQDNQINNSFGGVQVRAFDDAKVNSNITGNTIQDTSLAGIGVEFNQNSQGNVNIADNTISNVVLDELSDGIYVELFDNASADNISINNNTVSDTTGRGISIANFAENIGINLAITGNTVNRSDAEGIGVEGINGTTGVSNNTVKDTLSEGISLQQINGTATISNNTVENAAGSGISVTDSVDNTNLAITANTVDETDAQGIAVEGINGTTTISNNTVKNALDEAINLTNATGTVDITNNTVSDNQGNGIAINNDSGDTEIAIQDNQISNSLGVTTAVSENTQVAIANNQITNDLNGTVIDLSGTATASAQISNNTITGFNSGVFVAAGDVSDVDNLDITNNQITGLLDNLSQGVTVQVFDDAKVNSNITGNTIQDTSLAGIGVEFNQNSQGNVNIADNTISNVVLDELSDGIYVELFDNASADNISINNNTVSDTTGRGISIANFAENIGINLAITGNTVDTTGAEGIAVEGINGTTEVSNNTVTNGSSKGIGLTNNTGKVDITNNIVTDNQGNGIAVNNDSGNAEIAIKDNQISDNQNGAVIDLSGTATASAEITNNTITGADNGVFVTLADDSQLDNVDITANFIDETFLAGIGVEFNQNSQGNVNIANNEISNVEFDEFSDGIYIELFDSAATDGISILTNTITNTTGRGISVGNFAENTETNVEITGNNIDTTDAQGIGVEGVNGTTTIINNEINNAVDQGIYVEDQTGSENITGNTVTNTRELE
ncbi:right-handed parallel beta-helix repeat-containing protein [Plectonema cf. radiosum LEGE 06105]|uniref:Right-handed parallel beta-helix repeat-containing protein n=1 Tax=Plectonema cf. radiosum LEGE 06105 TaxID=945769 RepID=A0A8J7F325_9CYAN|nr:right-handed parallel beta-helix repeat-containing protein [Plectonema radiosum]MBE9215293.1 right-handed parallel beta-helix repeat-containing protein [Plectonema cf. radiosum LEGE 06105]